jgi:hypothetical protein
MNWCQQRISRGTAPRERGYNMITGFEPLDSTSNDQDFANEFVTNDESSPPPFLVSSVCYIVSCSPVDIQLYREDHFRIILDINKEAFEGLIPALVTLTTASASNRVSRVGNGRSSTRISLTP